MSSNRRSGALLWLGLISFVAGIAAAYTGYGLGALSLVPCRNQFSLDAPNYHCRSPLYWVYGGYVGLGVGVSALIAFAVIRIVNRKHQPVA